VVLYTGRAQGPGDTEMTPPQKELAQALLCAGLSQQGYMKAVTIMSLEEFSRSSRRAKARSAIPKSI